MARATYARLGGVAALITGGLLIGASAASAQDFTFDLPAGTACAFALRVTGTGYQPKVREFVDQDGNVVRTVSAGTGQALTLTNLSAPDESIALRSNGTATHTTINADGTQTVTSTGHHLLILFPTDDPAGPSTTLVAGHYVYTVGTDGVFHVQRISGKTTDICTLLTP